MNKSKFKLSKKGASILAIIGLFFVISFSYFPALLDGKVINAGDLNQYKGMSKELSEHRKATGDDAVWTNSLFGGMPGYLISTSYPGNLIKKIQTAFNKIPRPASYLIISFSMFFILCLILGFSPWVAAVAALAFGFSTFFFVVMQAGHATKAHTLTYMSLVIAGVWYAYNKKGSVGAIITAFGLSWMLSAGHPQMTYYCGLMVLVFIGTYFIYAIKEKTVPKFIKTSFLLLAALFIAVGTNFSRLYTTYEYGKYSMRGESELTLDEEGEKTSGLDKSYILDYSYGFFEAFSGYIPRIVGGGMHESLGEDSEVYQIIKKSQGKKQAENICKSLPLYWGSQPIVGAPFYFGAVLCFLFVLGLFVVKGKNKWWLAVVVMLSFLLSLGKNLHLLSDFMIDYFPMYNKFRDVKNIIVIQYFAMALLGALAVHKISRREIEDKFLKNALKYSLIIVGGFSLILAIAPGIVGNFVGGSDAQLAAYGWPEQLLDALRLDRKRVLRHDAWRSLIFVSLAAAGIFAFWTKKINSKVAITLWAILIVADMWPMNKKYYNSDHFVSKRQSENTFVASKADSYILNDTDLDYRVLNLTVSPWNDASTSYFHKSIGGYHGAKMKRYQELITYHLQPEIQMLQANLKNVKTVDQVDGVFTHLNALNMLNLKYVIVNPNGMPLENNSRNGNAWFVEQVNIVANADEEIEMLKSINTATSAVVDQRYQNQITSKTFDASGSIQMTSYAPNHLVYQSKTNSEQLAVFSEIYYSKGWNAYIDGTLVDHLSADFVLRAVMVPAGSHKIEFKFEPKSYEYGNIVSGISSLVLLILAGLSIFVTLRKKS